MSTISTSNDGPERRAITGILDAAARDPVLYNDYVLKGGLALQLVYNSPRRSDDLDFNAVDPTSNDITDATTRRLFNFAKRLDAGLANVAPEHGFERLAVDHQLLSKEIPTLMADIAYAADGEVAGHVKFQLTLSEIVCETTRYAANGLRIHAASLDDMIAEKLKALLQQITRENVRSADVFDIWYFTTASEKKADPAAVTQYLLEKKKQWDTMPPLEKGQFRRKSLIAQSTQQYSKLDALLPASFNLISFREAYECVLRFVDRLDIPT